MSERRYQVFISSTYTDLVEERREVMQALLELDCLPAGMELFPAANDDQWTLISEVIDQSDYYVVVVGGRYGSTTEEGISYTEKEYDYALAQGIPIIGFVRADPDEIPVGKSDIGDEARAKLATFRAKVMSKLVKEYSTPSDLGSAVSRSLVQLMKRYPREGWVRGSNAMTPETRTEIAELKASIAAFETAAAEERAEADRETLDLDFAHGSETVSLKVEYAGLEAGYLDKAFYREFASTWDEVIRILGPNMISEVPEINLRHFLESYILEEIADRGFVDGAHDLQEATISLTDTSWGGIVIQLRALNVIEIGSKKRPMADKAVYWKLTTAGDAYLVGLLAVPTGSRGDI